MFKIINQSISEIVDCSPTELYQYRVFVGHHLIETSVRCSYWLIDGNRVISQTGNNQPLESQCMCVEIFGYTPEYRSSTFDRGTDLPYVNGCSTKQLINANRPGDPTFQYLFIPAGTSEQVHHIHATPRVVYVLKGQGVSVVGTPGKSKKYDLTPGDVVVLEKMVPHHFETSDQDLIVLPLHVFSTVGQQEFDHPMYNGTHKI